MEEKDDFYRRICARGWDSKKQSLDEYLEEARQCRIQKWKDDEIYYDFVNLIIQNIDIF